ncbi:MAG: diguanylate cyclase [Polaromonas sp.]|nr:diguanylate cyclase [Polaromonas sp.]
MAADLQDPVRFMLLYAVMPAWLFAGLADWACHRRTGIAHTSGVKEAVLHVVMVLQGAVAVLAVMFLRVNAAVLLLLTVLLVSHALTTHWDLHYTAGKRTVGPVEQTVHAWLEALPLAAYVLVAAGAWPQMLAVFGVGDAAAQWGLHWRDDPLSPVQAITLLAASFVFGTLPFLEELYRSVRARS